VDHDYTCSAITRVRRLQAGGVGRELGLWGRGIHELKHVHVGSKVTPRCVRPSLARQLSAHDVLRVGGPTKLVIGAGRVAAAADQASKLGITRVLLISDPGIVKTGLLGRVKDALGGMLKATFHRRAAGSSLGHGRRSHACRP